MKHLTKIIFLLALCIPLIAESQNQGAKHRPDTTFSYDTIYWYVKSVDTVIKRTDSIIISSSPEGLLSKWSGKKPNLRDHLDTDIARFDTFSLTPIKHRTPRGIKDKSEYGMIQNELTNFVSSMREYEKKVDNFKTATQNNPRQEECRKASLYLNISKGQLLSAMDASEVILESDSITKEEKGIAKKEKSITDSNNHHFATIERNQSTIIQLNNTILDDDKSIIKQNDTIIGQNKTIHRCQNIWGVVTCAIGIALAALILLHK